MTEQPRSIDIAISVPVDDQGELNALAAQIGGETLANKALDGAALATLIASLSTTSASVVKVWLRSRVAARKGCTVAIDGMKLDGYDAKGVERIVKALESR